MYIRQAQTFVQRHWWLIDWDSRPGRTDFRSLLPLPWADTTPQGGRAVLITGGSRMEAVWVVDDDQSIRWVLERALGKEGLSVRVLYIIHI